MADLLSHYPLLLCVSAPWGLPHAYLAISDMTLAMPEASAPHSWLPKSNLNGSQVPIPAMYPLISSKIDKVV